MEPASFSFINRSSGMDPASFSSSSRNSEGKYYVFLNFRGQDTRDGFTSHLYKDLCRKGIKTFIDDNDLQRGDEISDSLLNAIEESKIAIIIFSQGYASSRWCLEELAKIIDCKESHGLIVVPVFYHVDPSHVRRQTGSFKEAFGMHEERFKDNLEKVQRWRSALTQAANLSGFDSKVTRPDSALVDALVNEVVLEKLNLMSPSHNKGLVGVEKSIKEIESLLQIESKDVFAIGIWGMGGIGKTTLARAIFDKIKSRFDRVYFQNNVREESKTIGLDRMQKKLLATILEDEHATLNSILTKTRLQRKKILAVFDDVTCLKQMKELIGEVEHFGSAGSRILIISRDMQVLQNCGVNCCDIYEVKGLPYGESLELFSLHAFKKNHPPIGYLELSRRVVTFVKGVPLALKIFGSMLFQKSKTIWESEVDNLEKNANQEICDVLKLSYDELNIVEKKLFLDIACFFVGAEKDFIINILNASVFVVSALIARSLINIEDIDNTITMHDLLQEMGRKIVEEELKYRGNCSSSLRNWLPETTDENLQEEEEEEPQSMILKLKALTQNKYDVFLSFKDEDTQYNFTSHLHAALSQEKIETFFDEELIRGNQFSSSLLLKAIEESRISVIIFSEGYASSKWCLNELVKILECKEKYDQVIPIYYHVDPINVWDQSESFGAAFDKLENGSKESSETLQRWRDALKGTASLCHFYSSKSKRCEADLVEDIVKHILEILNEMYPSDNKDLVGVQSSIEKIESLLQIESKDLDILGIWGEDGIGKTTIAKAVFEKIKNQFDNFYFALNVGEELENPDGLTHLQQELLSTILEDVHLDTGFTFMKQRFGHKKFLIVVDGVTSLEQIKLLIGDLHYFSLGSRIIITTRDKKVLRECGVDNHKMYRVKALSHHDALQLFSWYAFQQNRPLSVYNELSNRIVEYARGIPLALKLLGSFLSNRIEKVWETTIAKIERINGIQGVLKVCYDGLDDDEKNIFLDIACFFKQEDKDFIIKFLDVSGFFAEIGISDLLDKCFLTLSNNKIVMHDSLQKIGREIVRKEFIEDPSRCSRLWHIDDILLALKDNKDSWATEGLCLGIPNISNIDLNLDAFAKMHNLRFLKIFNSHCDENTINEVPVSSKSLESSFKELRYLCWHGYPLDSLPSNALPENLVAIEMPHCNIKRLWTGVQDLIHLKRINLSYSKNLDKILDLSRASNLETLILEGCINLSEICSSIQDLNNLATLNLKHCKKLGSLPAISSNIKELFLDETAIEELPDVNLFRLVTLDLQNCSNLKSLPSRVCNFKSLEHLNLSGCSNLDKFPDNLGKLKALKVFKAKRLAKTVPPSIGDLLSLIELNLRECRIVELPDSLGQLSSLQRLLLGGNDFTSIPTSIMDLSKLSYLDIGYCASLELLPQLPRDLQYLDAHNCTSLRLVTPSTSMGKRRDNFINCFKLEQLEEIDPKMKFGPRQSAYICFPGSEIPGWFPSINIGSSINLDLRSGLSNCRYVSFVVCATVKFRKYHDEGQGLVVGCDCKLGDRNGSVVLYYGIGPRDIDSDHIFLGYDLHSCLFDLGGSRCTDNEVSFQFYVEDSNAKRIDCCDVNKCGVYVFYRGEKQAVIDAEKEEEPPHKRLKLA